LPPPPPTTARTTDDARLARVENLSSDASLARNRSSLARARVDGDV